MHCSASVSSFVELLVVAVNGYDSLVSVIETLTDLLHTRLVGHLHERVHRAVISSLKNVNVLSTVRQAQNLVN